MATQCFYCNYAIDDQVNSHIVSFVKDDDEQEEVLCEECYHEWLHGIKG